MRPNLVTAVTLVSWLASSGYTTFSATLECAEVARALSIDVGDHPDHSLGAFQTKCTWVKTIEIRGTRSTAYTGTATLETQDSVSRLQGYGVIAFADGKLRPNMRLKLAGLSLLKESECCDLAGANYRSTSSALAGSPPAA